MSVDEYTALLKASIAGNDTRVRELATCAAANLVAARQHRAAKQITSALQQQVLKPLPLKECAALVETPPNCRLADLLVTPAVEDSINRLLMEQQHAERLLAGGFLPMSRILLHGSPGTGKTSLAHAVAAELSVPLLVTTAEEIWESYLGATSKNLLSVFRAAAGRRCVLLIDEADVLFLRRSSGRSNESSENSRITSTSLTQIPELPASTILFAATNLIENIDRAIFRRFDAVVELPEPRIETLRAFAIELAAKHDVSIDGLPLGDNFATAKQAVLARAKAKLIIEATTSC